MPIDWSPEARELHLHNDRISYVMRVHENGALGHLHFGAPLAPDRSYAHLGPTGFAGFTNRVGDPVAARIPDDRGPATTAIPALTVELRRRLDASSTCVYREHRIVAGKPARPAGDGLPATYVEADDEADTLEVVLADAPSGVRVELSYTIFRDAPVVARSARIRNGGTDPVRLTGAMSAALDLPDARWELVQLSGAWARENHVVTRRLRPGPPVGRQRPRRVEPPAQPVHRPPPRHDDRGRGRGLRLQPRLLGQLPRRGRGRPVRHDPRPARDQPEHLHLDPRAGRDLRDARGRPGLLGRRARRDERRAPRPLPRAARARRRGATRRGRSSSTTGRRPTSTSTRRSCSRSRPRRATSASSCSCSTTAGSASAMPTRPRSATGSSTGASCPTASTGSARRSRRSASGSGCGSSPR